MIFSHNLVRLVERLTFVAIVRLPHDIAHTSNLS